MGSDDILDILLLLFVIAILTPIMITNAIPLFKGDVGGFHTLIEKTAQESAGEIKPIERPFKREDVLLMAIIADRKMPQPARIQSIVDGTSQEITIDDLLNQRVAMLNELNSHTAYDGPLQLQTYIKNGKLYEWVVSRK